MSMFDLRFKWTWQHLTLTDITVYRRASLQEFIETEDYFDGIETLEKVLKGKKTDKPVDTKKLWVERDYHSLNERDGYDRYDHNDSREEQEAQSPKPEAIRYQSMSRWLVATANAEFSYRGRRLYVGVPKNKADGGSIVEKEGVEELRSFPITIREMDEDRFAGGIEHSLRFGSMSYYKRWKDDDRIPEEFECDLNVSPVVFDELEKCLTHSKVGISVTLNMKGWYFAGPIGDSALYLDREEMTGYTNALPVELASISFQREYRGVESEEQQADEGAEYKEKMDDYTKAAIEENVHLFNKLTELGKSLGQAKTALWIIVALLGYLAITS